MRQMPDARRKAQITASSEPADTRSAAAARARRAAGTARHGSPIVAGAEAGVGSLGSCYRQRGGAVARQPRASVLVAWCLPRYGGVLVWHGRISANGAALGAGGVCCACLLRAARQPPRHAPRSAPRGVFCFVLHPSQITIILSKQHCDLHRHFGP